MAISTAVNAAAAVPPASSHSASSALHENTPDALVMAAAGTAVTGSASAGPGSGRAGLDGSCEAARFWPVNRTTSPGYTRSGWAISWFWG